MHRLEQERTFVVAPAALHPSLSAWPRQSTSAGCLSRSLTGAADGQSAAETQPPAVGAAVGAAAETQPPAVGAAVGAHAEIAVEAGLSL